MLVNKVREMLNGGFETDLFNEAISGLQSSSKIRFSNFSYVMRELMRHMLDRLAPDKNVKNCEWFSLHDPEKPKMITRAQKVIYSIQGDFSDALMDSIGVDISCNLEEIKNCFEILNKYTHINASVFDIDNKKVESLVSEVLNSLWSLFQSIEKAKSVINDSIENAISQSTLETFYYETIDDIDCLATHHNIKNFHINNIYIESFANKHIELSVTGDVAIELQYGSDGDISRDMGFRTNMEFPFNSKIRAVIADEVHLFQYSTKEFNVDTDKFYE